MSADMAGAQPILASALKRFPDFPDLRFYDFLFSAKRWYEACTHAKTSDLLAPLISLGPARSFPKLAAELGFPLEMGPAPE